MAYIEIGIDEKDRKSISASMTPLRWPRCVDENGLSRPVTSALCGAWEPVCQQDAGTSGTL